MEVQSLELLLKIDRSVNTVMEAEARQPSFEEQNILKK